MKLREKCVVRISYDATYCSCLRWASSVPASSSQLWLSASVRAPFSTPTWEVSGLSNIFLFSFRVVFGVLATFPLFPLLLGKVVSGFLTVSVQPLSSHTPFSVPAHYSSPTRFTSGVNPPFSAPSTHTCSSSSWLFLVSGFHSSSYFFLLSCLWRPVSVQDPSPTNWLIFAQCCGTGSVGTETFCLSGTKTVFNLRTLAEPEP